LLVFEAALFDDDMAGSKFKLFLVTVGPADQNQPWPEAFDQLAKLPLGGTPASADHNLPLTHKETLARLVPKPTAAAGAAHDVASTSRI
jgi:hypothetical protein